MRLAIQDSWPNLPINAEREFIKRFQIACEAVGVECSVVVTSDDINAFDPAAVLVSHEFSRKLTGVPTIGMIWSPLSFFRNDPYRVKSLLSYDGYLAGNAQIQNYLKDLQFGVSARKPVSEDLFLPTTYRSTGLAAKKAESLSLGYVGVHWDGTRHRELFDELIRREMITCYGPEKSWKHISSAYGGFLPIDGRSVVSAIASHGIALCLHKAEHRAENTPSMRLFEALSVGALPICDDIAFARDNLSDFVEFIDLEQSSDVIADSIEKIINDARAFPERTIERAARGKLWFDQNWSLEHKIESTIIPLVEEVHQAGRFKVSSKARPVAKTASPLFADAIMVDCEVVIRTGGRSTDYLKRAIASVQAANSHEFRVGVILVDYKGLEEIVAIAKRSSTPEFPVRYVQSPSTGFRSTALWDGIKSAKAEFVAHMDDDDSVFQNHYRQLADCFASNRNAHVCYSGVVKVEDEDGFYTKAPNYDGPLDEVIEERRDLHFLEGFDLRSLLRFQNFIQSNTWMAKRNFIQSMIGDDPELVVVEDVYLYMLLATAGPFGFTGSPTAQWHWRSATNDNSMRMIKPAEWDANISRIRLRLKDLKFNAALSFEELTNPLVAGTDPGEVDKRTPDMLAPLNFNRGIEGGSEFKNRTIMRGFHQPEGDGMGVWSKDFSATMLFSLGDGIREQGGKLMLEYIGSMNEAYDRWVEFGVEGGDHVRVKITDWSMKIAEITLPPGLESPATLKVTSSHLVEVKDAHGSRQLGCFLRSVRAFPDGARRAGQGVSETADAPEDVAQGRVQAWLRRLKRRLAPIEVGAPLRLAPPAGGEGERDRRDPASLEPLDFNQLVKGGENLTKRAVMVGFNPPEGNGTGVWSSGNSASLTFGLSEKVRVEGGKLILSYIGSSLNVDDRWLELGLHGEDHQRVQVRDWSSQVLEIPLRPGLAPTVTLNLSSSHLVEVAHESNVRMLGCLIQSLCVRPSNNPRTGLPTTAEADVEADRWDIVSNGWAVGRMPGQAKSNLWFAANQGGVLIISGREGVIHLPTASDGGFVIPRRAADGATSFLYLCDKRGADGTVHLSPTDLKEVGQLASFAVERAAVLRDYTEAADGRYLAALLPPGAFGVINDAGCLLVGLKGGGASWKVRPSHGDIWQLLNDSGEGGEDAKGDFRSGILPLVAESSDQEGHRLLHSLSLSILSGVMDGLSRNTDNIPADFLVGVARGLVENDQ